MKNVVVLIAICLYSVGCGGGNTSASAGGQSGAFNVFTYVENRPGSATFFVAIFGQSVPVSQNVSFQIHPDGRTIDPANKCFGAA